MHLPGWNYDTSTGIATCRRCRNAWRIAPDDPPPIRHHCPALRSSQGGLGDRLAAFLKLLGIRQRRDCACDARREWLNRAGRWLARLWR
jgi:hypothetical protein